MSRRVIWSICLSLTLAWPLATFAADVAAPVEEQVQGPAISLADALHQAQQRNLSLQAARADLERAAADLKYAWSLLLPTANGTLNFIHNDHADKFDMGGQVITTRKQDSLTSNLTVAMPLINARAWVGVKLADMGEEVSALTTAQIEQTILLSVAQAYFAALSTRSLIEVQQEQRISAERHLAIATVRHRSGTGARLDVLRAKTELIGVREGLLAARTAYADACDALGVLIGAKGPMQPQAIEAVQAPPDDEGELVDLAQQNREDVRLSQALIALADKQLLSSWMAFVPSLNAAWQLNQNITDLGDFGDQDQSRWFIGLTLSIPLYDHTRYAQLDQQRAAVHKAQLQAEDTAWQASLEVRQARRGLLKARDLVATAAEKAALTRESLKLAESAYENGSGLSLDVTDARRTSRQAEIDLATKQFDAQLNLLQLMRTIGQDMGEIARKPGEGS